MNYEDRIKEHRRLYMDGLTAAPFEACGVTFPFMFYELHRVSWALSAQVMDIAVFDIDGTEHLFSPEQAREYLAEAVEMLTEKSRAFHAA